ncbi:hypothetical protein [Nodularia spumigena]|uniref:hypothetical protein n=1 Tax=Nodularia spumigena TaxID=70799 RepID=UPI00232BA1F6|nr:hypothetical protein [Nodularia spumigena]MDB9303078.1 hypothetical protein [Nodularia spumigena CS-591/12]MDB9316743.1 hypothetical protein [Nodularia spumigena CS-590/01A]MDB9327590.1 hypothetical protein [Nodularia spumigena CS-590/02]MDB9336092.1 hypothetical protein [Nodularia spumigena CS-590/01]MDB9344781.1 hypothetical protein [Nodularia spumigena CS-588/06]
MAFVTLTAAEIVGFIFTKVSETLIGKATEAVLPKINELRLKIISKLRSREKANAEIDKIEQGLEPDLELLASYLNIDMAEDPQFKEEVGNLANDINQEFEQKGESSNVMNVYGGKAFQQNQNKGEIYNADTITIHKHP